MFVGHVQKTGILYVDKPERQDVWIGDCGPKEACLQLGNDIYFVSVFRDPLDLEIINLEVRIVLGIYGYVWLWLVIYIYDWLLWLLDYWRMCVFYFDT